MHTLKSPLSASGCRNTTIHEDTAGGKVFLIESGAVGMEFNGRISVHSIERWIAHSWRDLPDPHAFIEPGSARSSTLRLGSGDAAISLRGHPYEK